MEVLSTLRFLNPTQINITANRMELHFLVLFAFLYILLYSVISGIMGRDTSVGIANRYEVDGLGIESR